MIGVGADSTELGVDLSAFAPAYEAATRLGLRRTCHAGEAVGVGPDNIRVALDILGADGSTTASPSSRTPNWSVSSPGSASH